MLTYLFSIKKTTTHQHVVSIPTKFWFIFLGRSSRHRLCWSEPRVHRIHQASVERSDGNLRRNCDGIFFRWQPDLAHQMSDMLLLSYIKLYLITCFFVWLFFFAEKTWKDHIFLDLWRILQLSEVYILCLCSYTDHIRKSYDLQTSYNVMTYYDIINNFTTALNDPLVALNRSKSFDPSCGSDLDRSRCSNELVVWLTWGCCANADAANCPGEKSKLSVLVLVWSSCIHPDIFQHDPGKTIM